MSIVNILLVVASFRYELAVPIAETERDADELVASCIAIVVVLTIIISLLLLRYDTELARILRFEDELYLWFAPTGLLFGGIYNTLSYWALRKKDFETLSKTRITQSVATNSFQLFAHSLGVNSLLLGQSLSYIVGINRIAVKTQIVSVLRTVTWNGLKKILDKYKKYPLISTWEALINTSSLQVPTILFAVFFNSTSVGLYALAHRILSLPLTLVGNAIGQVFLSNAANEYRAGRLHLLVNNLNQNLSNVGMPLAIIIAWIGADLFSIVFGSDWYEAGRYAQWMAPWLYFAFISSPLSTVFNIIDLQGYGVIFQLIMITLRSIAVYVGIISGEFYITVALFSLASALSYIILIIWTSRTLNGTYFELIKPTIKSLLQSLILTLPISIYYMFMETNLIVLSISITLTFIMVSVKYYKMYRFIM